MDLLIESHLRLKRQGPGSTEMTLKALSFVELPVGAQIADLGCGTGGQTMILAQNTNSSNITGVDFIPAFVEVFNGNAKKLSLQERVHSIVGSIDALAFEKESLDLIWSEGVIDSLGFGKMLTYWNGFLKKSGYVVVTCPSWLSDERPDEVQKFWSDAGSGMDSIESNIVTLQECGYQLTAAFVLPESCWTKNYYTPRKAAEHQLLKKYPGSEAVTEYVRSMAYEVELYNKFNYKEIIDNINKAIDWATENGIHVVYIRHENLSAGTRTFKPSTKGAELVSDLKMVSANIFTKTKGNALTSEAFADFISQNEIDEFYITGADAVACVKSTCFNMRKAGYDVNVLSDCITSYDKRKLDEMIAYYESKGSKIISANDL